MTILKPDVPDTVIRFIGERIPRILPSAADTVAIPIVHDWGPVGSDDPGSSTVEGGLQEITSFEQFAQIYGDSDTPGRTAVAGAFAGQGLPGSPGAGGVIVYRMAGSEALKATVTLEDRAGPANPAVTLTARYVGSRGNSLSVVVDTDPSNALRDRLQIRYLGATIETYLFLQTDVATLVASINNRSQVVRAVNDEVAPARLAAVAGQALTGGDDGATLASGDHLAALAALQLKAYLFTVLSPFDLTDSAVLASYVSWVQAQDAASRPVRAVFGGAAGETIDDALSRATACADPHVVTIGVGTYHDDLLDKDLSTSQLAPRIAGILAAKGEDHSLSASEISGLHTVSGTGATDDGIVAAVNGGVVVLMPADSPDADLRIAKGVSTFTAPNDPVRPVEIFGDPRLVGIMDNYKRSMRTWGNKTVIGDLPVNDDTRNLVRAHARGLQDDLLRRGLILPGDGVLIPVPWVDVQDTDADPLLDDAIPYKFGWQFAKTTNAILGEGHVL